MSADSRRRQRRLYLWGWLLFLVCAIFFIASGIEGSDTLGLVGSVIFLVACLVFIIPLLAKGGQDEDS